MDNLVLTIFGEITLEKISPIIDTLIRHPKNAPVTIFINSEGGQLYPALALTDVISCYDNTTSIGLGQVSSAATTIYMAANKRYISKHAYMLLHGISWYYGGDTLNLIEVDKEKIDHKRVTSSIVDFYVSRTNLERKKWNSLLKEESFLSSEKIISYGIAHELWTGKCLPKQKETGFMPITEKKD